MTDFMDLMNLIDLMHFIDLVHFMDLMDFIDLMHFMDLMRLMSSMTSMARQKYRYDTYTYTFWGGMPVWSTMISGLPPSNTVKLLTKKRQFQPESLIISYFHGAKRRPRAKRGAYATRTPIIRQKSNIRQKSIIRQKIYY